jgi:energy-coupling factor transport system ATP-binding protein
VIEFEAFSFTYPDADRPVLDRVELHIPEGELCLVVGRTGTGKSTLLRAINGLVPHFTGGTVSGRAAVAGRDTRTHPPRELADVVGVVGQDPRSGFVTDTVEEELAYGMESIGLPAAVMRRRVEEVLDLLGLVELRDRPLDQLSGGQCQRVAIGSVLTTHPRALVLDEPTSALDPPAAEEVLAALQRLVHDLGVTVVLAEHRLERVVQYADRLVHVPGAGLPLETGVPTEILRRTPVVPPVVELARVARWEPLPLSIRDARRRAPELRDRLDGREPPVGRRVAPGPVVAAADGLGVQLGRVLALRDVDLTVRAGEILAVMGRNGAGKSTLLRAFVGLQERHAGTVEVAGHDPAGLRPSDLVRHVGLVPQEPADLLYAETVWEECAAADRDGGLAAGTCAHLLDRIVPGLDPTAHPRDLSEGERLGLVLAIVMAAQPPLLLLDEPTRGLDYRAKERLGMLLQTFAEAGAAVVLATHDVELAAEIASTTVVLADGEIVSEGPTAEVVTASPAFAPQVAKVLAPLPWLTAAGVADSLQVLP